MIKQVLFTLLACCLLPQSGKAQQVGDYVTIDTTLILNREDYTFELQEDGTSKIVPANQDCHLGYGDYSLMESREDAAIPYFGFSLRAGKNEAFRSIDIQTVETLDAENFFISIAPPDEISVPTGAVAIKAQENSETRYSRNNYPDKQAYFTYQYLENLVLMIYPFRYDAAEKKLYFCKEINLHITLMATDGTGIAINHKPSTPDAQSPIYDLAGRRMATPPVQGVYIKGGRKIAH